MTSGVYLIHFDEPYKHAAHYVGYADDIEARFELHRKGQGSRLCEVVVEAGIGLQLVRVWPGRDRHFERKLHGRGKRIYCPVCNSRHYYRHAPVASTLPDVEL